MKYCPKCGIELPWYRSTEKFKEKDGQITEVCQLCAYVRLKRSMLE